MFESAAFGYTVLFVIVLNVLWYFAKFFIRRNGLKSDWFWGHLRDFYSLYKLSTEQFPDEVRAKAKLYLTSLVGGLVLFFGLIFGVII